MSNSKDNDLEKKLKETEVELSDILNIINSLRDAIIFIDEKNRVIRATSALLEIGGFEEKDIVGKSILQLRKYILPKSYLKIMQALTKRLVGENTPPYEVVLKKKNGEEVDIEILGSPLYKKGKIVGSVAVLRDISKRKKIENDLKERNDELERLNKIMIGRELKMRELKNEVQRLKEELKEES